MLSPRAAAPRSPAPAVRAPPARAPLQQQRGPRHRPAAGKRPPQRGGGGGGGKEEDVIDSLLRIADKAAGAGMKALDGAVRSASSGGRAAAAAAPRVPFTGLHALLLSLAAAWAAAGPLGLLPAGALALDRARPWTALADAWFVPSGELLARNLFLGYMFGRAVDNVEGSRGLWLGFVLSAIGGSLAALLLLPKRAPLPGCAASGALFGLFALATVFSSGKAWHWHRWFEIAVLLPFVALQLTASHAGLAQWCVLHGTRVGAWVPLAGGLAGAAAAAALLALGRVVVAGLRQNAAAAAAAARPAAGAAAGGGDGAPARAGTPAGEEPASVLLTRAATLLLRKMIVGL
ncbi:hypothetical protein Rsub_10760 [Raphidocelis subcapitata]|uniref:Peptidase S54 rhomboid domain-containing protein n=1 Tax=Raphidocelis subcapitata TaxID=307507 RepID=A0A2V0PMR1_9CHLO|nr:hypothetical protein Rsub_10760 [Raphidocelis subcapitata]|eukprot:GBF98365.1 hypothetical protein Rsub_10760 [Raphidocelis subcapitata]